MTTQQMTARTMSMTLDPMRENPVTALVAGIRAMDADLTPRQREIRDNGRRRTDALLSTGLYSFAARS